MDNTPLSFACGLYDRMVPLAMGHVKARGLAVDFIDVQHSREVFDRMGGNLEFDASEFSSAEFITRYSTGDRSLVAIPAFPSKTFRHSFIFVNTNSVTKPTDLNGKKIGVPLYTMTAAVWIRGLLQHEYQVDLSNITWIEGDVEKPGAYGKPSAPPLVTSKTNIVKNITGKSLSEMLTDGDLDAIIGPDVPSSLTHTSHVRRLFPNFKEVEMQYFRKTGVFPIMHLVVLRSDYYQSQRYAAASLYHALVESKNAAIMGLRHTATLKYMLPWLPEHLEEIDEVFGRDCWKYGLEENRKTIEVLVQYLKEQDMITELIKIEELFVQV